MSEIKDNSKVYYWIKLKTDFFESDAIDFLYLRKTDVNT